MLVVAYAAKLDVVAPVLQLEPAEVDVSGALICRCRRRRPAPGARRAVPAARERLLIAASADHR